MVEFDFNVNKNDPFVTLYKVSRCKQHNRLMGVNYINKLFAGSALMCCSVEFSCKCIFTVRIHPLVRSLGNEKGRGLNVFTEFAEFSDKKLKIKKEDYRVGTQDLLCKRQTVPLSHRATGNRGDPYTEPNSCLSDFSDSLNSLNSAKVLLHLEKTPVNLFSCFWNSTKSEKCPEG